MSLKHSTTYRVSCGHGPGGWSLFFDKAKTMFKIWNVLDGYSLDTNSTTARKGASNTHYVPKDLG